jgi:hypothetical protein
MASSLHIHPHGCFLAKINLSGVSGTHFTGQLVHALYNSTSFGHVDLSRQ